MATFLRHADPRSIARSRFRVELFVGLLCVGAAAAWLFLGRGPAISSELGFGLPWWSVAFGFFVAEAWAVHVHFRSETHSISLNEIALVPGLLFLPPGQLILAQLLGAGLALGVKRRQRSTKLVFNLASFVLSTSLAVGLLHALGTSGHLDALDTWVAVLGAGVLSSAVGIALVSSIIWVAEGEWSGKAIIRTGTISLATTLATTSFVLAATLLVAQDAYSALLFIGPILCFLALFRAYMQQTRSHQHLAFLYDSMAATQSAPDFGLAVTQLLAALRDLVRADYAEIVLLFDDEGQALRSVSSTRQDMLMVPGTVGEDMHATLAALAGQDGSALVARGDDHGALARLMVERGLADVIVSTLADDGRVFGLMIAGNRSGDIATFTRDEQTLVRTFAGHASVLLENGRLEKTLADVTELQEKLHHLAYHDPLTELPNRSAFLGLVDAALAAAHRDSSPAVLFLDLDDFKSINDTHGHAAGNHLLIEVGARLQGLGTEGVSAARLGGDEFAILVENGGGGRAQRIAAMVEAQFANPVAVDTHRFPVAPSIGVALSTPGMTSDELLRNADVAMYAAKAAGKGCTRVFEGSMYERIRTKHELAQDIRSALEGGQFFPVFQPIVRLRDGWIVGFEALVRWNHPTRGILPPRDFLPLAEETGLMGAIDAVVMQDACATLSRWRSTLPEYADLRLNLNVSPNQLLEGETVRRIERTIAANGLETSMITLEITEGAAMQDAAGTIERARALVARGLEIAIDDFGTGHSSLARLEQFPLASIKIAKPFVDRLEDPRASGSFVSAILEIARAVGAVTVAEGIETENQVEMLRALGCELGQGYLFARPLTEQDADRLLAARWRLPHAA